MFFLLRAAFWIGLVLILIPSEGPRPPDAPKIATGDAVSAAAAALSDATRFCDRQPEACAVGSQTAAYLGHRAQAGAKRLYGIVNDKGEPRPARSRAATISSQNTLSAGDRAIPFRAPPSRTDDRRNAS